MTARKLHGAGIATVGEVARIDEAALIALLGRASGRHLHALAHNRDPRRVQTRRRRGSIGAQRALGRRPTPAATIDASLIALVDRVTRRMRAAHRVGRTVTLRLRFDDSSRITRSSTLPQATAETTLVLAVARRLLEAAQPIIAREGLTLVGVTVSNLEDSRAVQLAFPSPGDRRLALDVAVDGIRERFGSKSITRAVLLGRDPGLTVPLLPD